MSCHTCAVRHTPSNKTIILIRLMRQVLMAPRPALLRAIRTNMTARASVAVADAAVAGSGSKALWFQV